MNNACLPLMTMPSYDKLNVPSTGRLAACICSTETTADDDGSSNDFFVAVWLSVVDPFTPIRPIFVLHLVGFIDISQHPLLRWMTSKSSINAPLGRAAGIADKTETEEEI